MKQGRDYREGRTYSCTKRKQKHPCVRGVLEESDVCLNCAFAVTGPTEGFALALNVVKHNECGAL